MCIYIFIYIYVGLNLRMSMCIVDVYTYAYTYTSLTLSVYLYMYNGRYLCIPNIKYTIFLMCMHLACMYSYFEKIHCISFFGTLIDFPLLIFTLFI